MKKFACLVALFLLAVTAQALEKSMAVAQIDNLEASLDKVASLAEALEFPVPPEALTAQLGGMIMSPGLQGVDIEKPITIYIGKPDEARMGQPAIVARFSVTGDGTEYLDAVGGMLPGREELKPGVYKFAIGPAEMENAPAFFAVIKETQALVGLDISDIKELSGDLTSEDTELLKNISGTVSVLLNVDLISEMLTEQIASQKKMMEAYKAQMEAEGVDTSVMFENDPSAMMDSYADIFQKLLAQLDSLVISVNVDDNVTLLTHFRGNAGSVLEKIIQEAQPPSSLFTGLVDPQSLISGYGTMTGFDHMLAPYADWMGSLYSSMGPPFDKMSDSYKKLILGMKGLYTGGYNFLLLPPKEDNPLQAMGIYEISDKAQAQAYMEESMKLQEEQFETLKEEGFSVKMAKLDPSTYQDVEIETYQMQFGLGEEMTEDIPAPIAAILTNLTYHTAFIDNYMVYGFGDREAAHRAIDYVKAGNTTASKPAGFEDIQTEAVAFWEINVARLVSAVSSILQQAGVPILSDVGAVQAGIRGLVVKEHDGVSSMIRLTQADIKGFMEMGQKLTPKFENLEDESLNPDQLTPFEDEAFEVDDVESNETEVPATEAVEQVP